MTFSPENKQKKSDGFSLIEAILAASLFLLVASVFAGALVYGQQNLFSAGSRSRALFLAQEGLEAVRNVRDADFSNLTDGTKGLIIQDGIWKLTDEPADIDIFTRQIEISTIDENTKKVSSTVIWNSLFQEPNSVTLVTYFTNWRTPPL